VLYREGVRSAEIPPLLAPLFARWGAEGIPGEGFGDFCLRVIL
jgi:sulfite reductase beta subunit-like hemoprotein